MNTIHAKMLLLAACLFLAVPGAAQEAEAPDSVGSPDVLGTAAASGAAESEGDVVKCANWVYGTPQKTSRCFADKFLRQAAEETRIKADTSFTTVQLAADEVFDFPFAVMTGEGNFTLSEAERENLKRYVEKGGFLLASAGCSDPRWADSFENEIAIIWPDQELEEIYLDHEIFSTVHQVDEIRTSRGNLEALRGIRVEGRLALVYSPEGLNDTGSVRGCCCCGGNEVRNSLTINVNIFAYALTH